MTPTRFRAWDTKWSRWILPNDITYSGSEWWFDRRAELDGDVIETATMGDIVLMQSTGLLDKNGKEIFEGDVIQRKVRRLRYEGEWLVVWDELNARFLLENGPGLFHHQADDEIIGNIYEHPHLLK